MLPAIRQGWTSHRRAECEERIKQLLSALEGGTCLRPGNTGNDPKAVIRDRSQILIQKLRYGSC